MSKNAFLVSDGNVKAAFTGGALVVETLGAQPKLWRGALPDASVATLEIAAPAAGDKDGMHRILLNAPSLGTAQEVAAFATADEARAAFAVIGDALMEQGGSTATPAKPKRNFFVRWLIFLAKALVWVIFLIIIGFIFMTLAPKKVSDTAVVAPSTITAPAGNNVPAGTPIPADKFFAD